MAMPLQAHKHLEAQAKAESAQTVTASPGGPRLTFPVATASYMAGTKSSVQKVSSSASPVVVVAAAAAKPRVKSEVAGIRGDDR